jgi:hypothetical protein
MGRIWKAAQQLMSRLVLIVLAATAIATFASWRLAKFNEREHIHKMTRLAASAVEADLRSDMEAWMLGQIRLAKMWEFGEPTYSQWTAFAGLYLEHHPGCVAIVCLDPKYQERWVREYPWRETSARQFSCSALGIRIRPHFQSCSLLRRARNNGSRWCLSIKKAGSVATFWAISRFSAPLKACWTISRASISPSPSVKLVCLVLNCHSTAETMRKDGPRVLMFPFPTPRGS